ncbi:MAG: alpha-2-macroglobulin family protein [Thermoanaerobaculia bacterium]
MKRLIAVLVLLQAAPLFAKDLYITVRRDFGPAEAPEIELHYSRSAPFLVRLYRPKEMKEFIASQVDLRRAWRRPAVEWNSAKYLFSGLNKTHLELDWLRAAADLDLRKRLMGDFGGSSWSPSGTRLTEGPAKLVAGPGQFDLVTEFSFVPDTKDAKAPFDVPGFDWWFSREGRLRQKVVTLPSVTPGFYLVQVLQGDLEGQVVLVVNDLQVALQETDGAALVRVARRDGRSVPGAQVDIRNLQGAWVAAGKTDADGVLELYDVKETELLAVVREKDSTAIVDTEFFPTTAVFPDVYLYTDRPLYRKGAKVRFRGILRENAGGLSRLVTSLTGKSETARVSVVDLAGGTVVAEVPAPVSEFGTFSGELNLGAADLNGVYRVMAKLAGASHIGEFRVREYVKPLFFFKVQTAQETLQAGGTLTAEIAVERYAGGVPPGVKVSAQLFRVRAQSPQWVEDAGLGETGSATTYGWDLPKGESIAVPFPVADADNIELDASGKATLTLKLPETLPGPPNYDYSFVLRLYGEDPDGNSASFSKSFTDARSEVVALAKMSSVYASAEKPATLSIRAVFPSGKPYGRTRGHVAFTLTPYEVPPTTREIPFSTGEDGRFQLPIPTDTAGRLDAVVTLLDRFDKPTTAEASIVVAPEKPGAPVTSVSEVTIFNERDSLAPGETARALVLLPDGWGEGGSDQGRLYLTVAGRRIYEQRVQKVKGLSAWITQPMSRAYGTSVYVVLGYPDPVRGWTERTLTFRIPPKDKALSVSVKPHAAFVRPGQRQALMLRVVDAAGRPVEAEVSVAVVDKAVLALQPEFRPSLLPFFYPFERLNLMSFFSREFQSYGYGERLARLFRPNFWLAATKPDKKDQKEDDTAYWNARVVTDADGRATVSFRLPANQTTWNVSAVAVDERGRFGEGGASFGTNAPVTLSVAAPPFLRRGDRAQVRLLVSNQEKKGRDVSATLTAGTETALAAPVVVLAKLSPKQEASGRGEITLSEVASEGSTSLATTLVSAGETQRFAHPLRTLVDTVPVPESRTVRPGESVAVSLGPGESLSEMRVSATNAFTAAVVPSLKWLLGYPWGCAEQVTSMTVPSLLVASLFDPKNGAPGASEEEMRRSAAEFSTAGIARLKALQNPDGSFAWWPGSGKGDPTMSALVLMLLVSLDDPAPLKTLDAPRSLGWLKGQTQEAASSESVVAIYIESRLTALGLLPAGGASVEAALRFHGEWVAERGTVLDRALLLLAIRDFGFEKKPGLDHLASTLLASVSSAVSGALEKPGSEEPKKWTPLAESWPSYPGRLGSTLAIAAHALKVHGRLDPAAEKALARRLLDFFDGRCFGSTFETSQVLVHSSWLIREGMRTARALPKLHVRVAGAEVPSSALTVRETPGGVEISVDPREAAKGPLTVEGGGDDVRIRVFLVRVVPFGRATAVPGGWDLKREYFRIHPKSGALTPLDGNVSIGDLVYVRLSFQARTGKLPWWASSYYLLADQVPAGFAVVEEDKIYDGAPFRLKLHEAGYATRDIRSDRVTWTFAFGRAFMDRAFQTGYVLRAQYAGDFAAGVARLEDFYDEKLYSQTASRRLGVDPLPDRPRGR